MQNKFYVTTPIYYVNDKPHIGHAYTTILADVLARYHRLLGVPTFFLTGTDEHGQKVQKAADAAGMTPQQQADTTVVRFQELWRKLEITNDDFIRTTEPRHTRVVQAMLQSLYDKGEIYRAEYDGWYCVPCERFFMEKDLAEGRCPECGRAVERIREANYFFRMSKYQRWLIEYIQEYPKFIQPDFRRNETLGFLQKPLADLCISRPKSRLSWGIELPFDRDYVCYVWFDALVNYVSAVGYLSDDEKFRKWWPATYHLVGKDILITHTVYWPTMLKACGVEMPETIFAHGWWLVGDTKMSKSLGNVVNPMDMIERYGVDAFRYFLIAEMAPGQDASFTEDAFARRYNADLVNDLGNLLNRWLHMSVRYGEGRLPVPGPDPLAGAEERELWDLVQQAVAAVQEKVPAVRIQEGVTVIWTAVRAANRYLERKQPWALARDGRKDELGTTLYMAAEVLRVLSALLYPIMPQKMAVIRKTVGSETVEPTLAEVKAFGALKPGRALQTGEVLFPRIRPEEHEAGPAAPQKPAASLISYDDFMKVELRTARVLSAEALPGARKLLRLEIDLGGEKRQLVAGIAQHYKPEDVVGKTIVVVANLQPANIRGVESQGMLLAASAGDDLRLVTVAGEIPPGAVVK
jgi:methionyl-tRNA synthetase